MTPDKLPEEITDQIKQAAQNMLVFAPDNKYSYIAGATAWAPWKVKYDELQLKGQKLADALEWIYTYGPGDATTTAFINKALSEWNDEKINETLYVCPCCKGDGKETCTNPDHGFIEAMPGDIGRLGCPVCGHDPKHKIKNGGPCNTCNGTGKVDMMLFKLFCNETGYDDEPVEWNDGKGKESVVGKCTKCGRHYPHANESGICNKCGKEVENGIH